MSGSGLKVLSGGARARLTAGPRAHACLAAAWLPSKRDGFVRNSWLASWLAGRLAGWLAGVLAGWLAGCLRIYAYYTCSK